MIERVVPLEELRSDGIASFSLGDEPGAPFALLSLRSRGSMKYFHGEPNPVRENFFRSQGIEPSRVLAVELVHSRVVLFPQDPGDLSGRQADGIIVEPGPWVPTVTVADCMPVWIRHGKSGAFGVLHSGWQGTGILEHAVRGLKARYGALPGEIDAVLGPHIGPCCYKVSRERAEAFRRRYGRESVRRAGETWSLDLAAANRRLARNLGLRSLTIISGCTACDTELGSFRREGPERFTRMVAAAVCTAPGSVTA